ncbi:hypothetical protein GGR10_000916, partial [Bartonella chomelii]|nr:hypothetical protein [Bartonella chomelii]
REIGKNSTSSFEQKIDTVSHISCIAASLVTKITLIIDHYLTPIQIQ